MKLEFELKFQFFEENQMKIFRADASKKKKKTCLTAKKERIPPFSM